MLAKILDKDLKRFFSNVTKEEAKKGIFIDFEGFEDKSPTLIGVLIENEFTQIIFDKNLKSAADKKGLAINDAKQYLTSLTQKAKKESRRIFAFSQYENNIFKEFYGLDIDPYYCDVRFIAKKLKTKKYQDYVLKSRELKKYLEMINFKRPAHLGEQKSTKRIRDVLAGLQANNNIYDELTNTQKSKWTNLLAHNKIDVLGMQAIVKEYLKISNT